jgi:hypothetical protein
VAPGRHISRHQAARLKNRTIADTHRAQNGRSESDDDIITTKWETGTATDVFTRYTTTYAAVPNDSEICTESAQQDSGDGGVDEQSWADICNWTDISTSQQ